MSAIETVDNELLKYILKDITPEKERVLLTVSVVLYRKNNFAVIW